MPVLTQAFVQEWIAQTEALLRRQDFQRRSRAWLERHGR